MMDAVSLQYRLLDELHNSSQQMRDPGDFISLKLISIAPLSALVLASFHVAAVA